MIRFKQKGNFQKTEKFIEKVRNWQYLIHLTKYGAMGVEALSAATPVDSGLTARSWDYKIEILKDTASIVWTNSNIVKGYPIAIILDYGHATGNGGYVSGRHYISPAIQPIFDKLAEDAWKEVSKL